MKILNTALVTLVLSFLSGCLSGSSTGESATTTATYNASSYFNKTAVGNTWTLTGTTSESGIINSTGTIADTFQNTAFSGGVVTQTDTTTTNGVAAAPTTSTAFLAPDGSLQTVSGSTTTINLPATFSVGSTWTATPAITGSTAATGTVLGVNVSCSSNSATFTDCIKVSYTWTSNGSGTSNSATYYYTTPITTVTYYSPSVGNAVQVTATGTATYTGSIAGTVISTVTEQLQAGYVALDSAVMPTGYVSQGGLTWMPLTSTLYTYAQAVTLCSGTINGLNGWRLPTEQELINLGNSGAMNGQGWSLGVDLWSATPNPNIANNYYLVYLPNPSLIGTAVATNSQTATCVL